MRYIGALDVGTTNVRFHILDEEGNTIASSTEKIQLLYPKPNYVEIDPDALWTIIVNVIKNTLTESKVSLESIVGIGISTQRGSFTTWNSKDGRHYHNFITWKDLRADNLVKEWNSSIIMKILKMGSKILYTFSRNKRFLGMSVFKFMNTQMSLRLVWVLQHVPGLQEAMSDGNVLFGGIDSWLLYKFTGKHVTDISSASATGIFDPFIKCWSSSMINLLKLPHDIFPQVVETSGNFGSTPKDLFGVEIPILCSTTDQSASLFGSMCMQPGDLKITMGTGTFLNVNTGDIPHASVAVILTGKNRSISGSSSVNNISKENRLYPLIAWQTGDELVYMAEGAWNETGGIIEWAKEISLIDQVAETANIANSVNDSDGVYFVPAFSGLHAPINDYRAAAGFIGLKPTTRKNHLVRALLESIVFGMLLLYETLCSETSFTYKRIRVDGGVSKNDFILQLLADLTGLEVERASSTEISILGIIFLTGLQCGM
ncbi:Putative glycerol kinase [Apis cerana cerana]|uniref:Glycerol kinase 5 n=1 Tax=Apis cerana cerana TaxID=94128 RepID=A0A2A3ESN0_APICC|nr:Putative glycerol kinase [Apis cerana cerana]